MMVGNFTCSSINASNHVPISSTCLGKVDKKRETAKLIKYGKLSADYKVVTVKIKLLVLGVLNGLELMRVIGKKMA